MSGFVMQVGYANKGPADGSCPCCCRGPRAICCIGCATGVATGIAGFGGGIGTCIWNVWPAMNTTR